MSNDLPTYITSYRVRAAARVDRIATENLAVRTIELVDLHERRIETLLEELRCLRDGLASAKLAATEAERLYRRAADRYRATHRRALPWAESATNEGREAA